MFFSKKFIFKVGLCAVVAFVSLFVLRSHVEYRYLNPEGLIPTRHFSSHDNLNIISNLYGDSVPLGQGLRIAGSDIFVPAQSEFYDPDRLVGIKMYFGTHGKVYDVQSFDVSLHFENHTVSCPSKSPLTLKDNSWAYLQLKCASTSKGTLLQDIKSVEIRFAQALGRDKSVNDPLALYRADCKSPANACNKEKKYAALSFVVSRYLNDIPPLTMSEAENYGGLWDPNVRSMGGLLLQGASSLLLGLWLVLSWDIFFKRHMRFKPSHALVAGFLLWVTLLGHQILRNPALQNPDDPQHLLGHFEYSLSKEDASKARTAVLDAAYKSKLLVSAEHPGVPILADVQTQPGLGSSDFVVNPDSRSFVYGSYSKILVPVAWGLFTSGQSVSGDVSVFVRVALLLPTVTLVFAALLFHLYTSRFVSASFLLLALLNPASLSMLPSVSNYGWSIALGAVFVSFLVPEGQYRVRASALALVPLLLFFLAESSKPNNMLVLIVPLLIGFIVTWNMHDLRIRARSQRGVLFLAIVPLGLVLCSYFFSTFWIERVLSPLRPHVEQVALALESKQFKGFADLIRLGIPYSRVSLVGGFTLLTSLVLALGALFQWGSRRTEARFAQKNLWRWLLTLGFLLVIICALLVLRVKFPQPEFAPNIYRTDLSKSSFLEFAVTCINAFLSQHVHFLQDYYLWQTNFMAYGWLDTVTHQGYYFLLRQLANLGLISCGLALIWRTKDVFFLCLPWFFLGSVYWLALLFGAWQQQHTLLGRYLLPVWGLYAMPLVLGAAFLYKPRDWARGSVQILSLLSAFFALSVLFGHFHILPFRFLVGG
jgi:hypothetical protein